jgi:hypothetical protein
MGRNGTMRILAASVLTTVCALNAQADVVTDWNVIALNATAVPPNSILQSRTLAIVHGAIYDAARAVDRKSGAYAVDAEAPAGFSVEAAVAAAAHAGLVRLAPAERAMLDAALNSSLSKIPDGQGKTDGITLGRQIAEKIVALRRTDGADAKIAFTPEPGAGLYQLTPPQLLPAILPQWGAVAPFVLRNRVGLDFKGAPAITTAQFAREFEEVKSVGARNSTTRTADQTAAAFSDRADSSSLACGRSRRICSQGLSLSDNARLFALLSMASADRRSSRSGKNTKPALAADHRHPSRLDLNSPALNGNAGWSSS